MPLLSTEMSYLGFLLLLRCQSPLLLLTAVLDGLILNTARNAAGRHLRQFMENNNFLAETPKPREGSGFELDPAKITGFLPFWPQLQSLLLKTCRPS